MACHAIAFDPDGVQHEIGVEVAEIEFRRDAGRRGGEAQHRPRAEGEDVVDEDAVHAAQHHRVALLLLPAHHVFIRRGEGPEKPPCISYTVRSFLPFCNIAFPILVGLLHFGQTSMTFDI